MTRYFCDLCGVETTNEHPIMAPRGKAVVNGKDVWLHLDTLRDTLGFSLITCAGCLMMAVGSAGWILDPSETIKEVTV